MKILKPKKSKFDEDLASRVNEEAEKKIVVPEKKTVVAPADIDNVGFYSLGNSGWIISKDIVLIGKNWNEAQEELRNGKMLMCTPFMFFEYMNLLHNRAYLHGSGGLYDYPAMHFAKAEEAKNLLDKLKTDCRIWLNACFHGNFIRLTMEQKYLLSVEMHDYLDYDCVADATSIKELGLPTREAESYMSNPYKLHYNAPKNECVVKYICQHNYGRLKCNESPKNHHGKTGVIACKKIE